MPFRTINPRYIAYNFEVGSVTDSTTPGQTDVVLGDVTLDRVEVYVPPGHSGLTGFRVMLAGEPIIPYGGSDLYVVTDNAELSFEVGIEVDTGLVWEAFNNDEFFLHTFYTRWLVRDIDAPSNTGGVSAPVAFPISQSMAPQLLVRSE